MKFEFEMTLPSTDEDVVVKYEFFLGDPETGQPDGFDYSLSNEQGEIMYGLTEKDYETIIAKIDAHFFLQVESDNLKPLLLDGNPTMSNFVTTKTGIVIGSRYTTPITMSDEDLFWQAILLGVV